MRTVAVIPAAGAGRRMGDQKQLMLLGDKPVLAHTLTVFEEHEEVDGIIVAASECVEEALRSWKYKNDYKKIISVIKGGGDRQASVWACLSQLGPDVSDVLIHDGARPLVTKRAISDVLAYVRQGHCAISGVKSKDTIKITVGNGKNIVKETPDRECVWLVQTPQGFPYKIIKKAHRQAIADDFTGTDDSVLVERMGVPVYMIEGDYCNIKLTTPEDLHIAEALVHNDNLEIEITGS